MGVIMGALMIHGLAPGPMLIQSQPTLFWAVIASMFVGNLLLIVLNVPLLPLFVALLRIPQRVLAPLILVFCIVGAYSLNNSAADAVVMSVFGVLGWLLRKAKLDPAPFLLAFVLGGLFERSIRQAMLIGGGSPMIFIHKPISAALLALALVVVLIPPLRRLWRRKSAHREASFESTR
jgi:putative tricarboxylic transport membrane protein